jgi:CBS domain-containing protein
MIAPFAEKMARTPAEAGQDDPLDQPVQNVMRADVVTVFPDTPAAEVVTLLLQKGYRSLPVITETGRILGIITDGDLLRRAKLSTRLDLHAELSAADWQRQLAELEAQATTAANLMTAPVLTLASTAPLRQAVELMVTHNLKRLPVVNGEGRLAGWVSRVDVLRTLDRNIAPAEPAPEPAAQGTSIAELLYRDVPTVTPHATLEEIMQALEKDRRRRAVVVDDDRRVVGIITDGDLLRRAQPASRAGLSARLRALLSGRSEGTTAGLPAATETAADLMSAPAITIRVDAAPAAALRLMLEHGIKRLPVVDVDGRLVGLLGRGSLLRGLMPPAPPPTQAAASISSAPVASEIAPS